MLILGSIPSKETIHRTYQELVDEVLPVNGFEMENLGVSADTTKNVYGLRRGDFSKPTIMIVGSQHGSEWTAAHGVIMFLKALVGDPEHPMALRNHLQKLDIMFSWYIIPCANPWGYEHKSRHNYNGVNLNNDHETKVENETKILHEKFEELKPAMLIDCHTLIDYPDTSDPYNVLTVGKRSAERWVIGVNQTMQVIMNKQIKTGGAYMGAIGGSTQILRNYASAEPSRNGKNTIGTLVEAAARKKDGTYTTPDERAFFCANGILVKCIHFEHWFTNRTLFPR